MVNKLKIIVSLSLLIAFASCKKETVNATINCAEPIDSLETDSSIVYEQIISENEEIDILPIGSNTKSKWIDSAFRTLESGIFPRIKAISWWDENFDNSYLKVNSSPESLQAYRNGVASATFVSDPVFSSNKLEAPTNGIYHCAYPDFGGTEDIVTAERIDNFETNVNKNITWAYFSNNWYDNIQFPVNAVTTIHNAGKVPFIRMMPRSNFNYGGPDLNYTMQRILDGEFDSQIIQWAIDASNMNIPLLVEFGTEVNGNWFPWNGEYNGGEISTNYGDNNVPDGPERFRDAYKKIIDICDSVGANNITWFFHIDAYSQPYENWNSLENYYPGDSYIDWLGISVYGPQEAPGVYQEFSEIVGDVYPALSNLSNKPIAILEFAITELD